MIVSCQTVIKEPNRNYSKNACKERDFVGVTKKHGNKVFSAQNIRYLSGASSLALAVCVGPITLLQWAIASFLASTSANISPLNGNNKILNVRAVKRKKFY